MRCDMSCYSAAMSFSSCLVPTKLETGGGVFKDYSNRHSDLHRHENGFLGLTSVWKLVFRADVGMETSFHAGVGRNAVTRGAVVHITVHLFFKSLQNKSKWNF